MSDKPRVRRIRYKVITRKKEDLFVTYYATAEAIINNLGSGLSKDIVYRKVKLNNTFTGFRKTPHDHIKIYKLKAPLDWTDDLRSERRFIPAGC